MTKSFAKSLLIPFGFATLLSVPVLAHASESVPQWVRDAAAESAGTYPADTEAVMLLHDETLTVQGPGKAVDHIREVIRILRPSGREYANFGVPFDKDRKILSMHVWSIGSDGREHQLKDSELVSASPLSQQIYYDVQYRRGTAPAAEPGAVVAIESEVQERPYMAERLWEFQSAIPMRHGRFTLQMPTGFEYRAVWSRHAPVEPAQLGSFEWRWTLDDVSAVDLHRVSLAPSFEALAGRMAVQWSGPGMESGFHGSWQGVGEWAFHLAEDRFTPTPEISAKTAEVVGARTDFYAKASAIADYMQQNIRYFGVEIGVGGYQPHSAAEVFQHQYGDCKDKATLFVSMAQAAGLHGVLVLVHASRGVIDPKAPSSFANHMIAALEVPPGADVTHLRSVVTTSGGSRYVIFDPTQQYIPFGELPYYEQSSYGLIINGPHSQLVQFPVEQPGDSVISRSAHFKLAEDGSVSGSVTEDQDGNYALWNRELLQKMDQQQRDRWLDHKLKRDLGSYQLASFHVDHVSDLNSNLEMKYSVTAPNYSKSVGPMLLLRPRVLGEYSPDLDDQDTRKVPIDLETAGMRRDDFSIDLPTGYTVDELPDPVKLDVGFAYYESSTKVEGSTLHYTRIYTLRVPELSPDKYDELKHLAAVIHADEQGSAVLKRVQ